VLNIFPEGCCTNGTKLIKFKKGAFCSLRAVAPLVIKYKTPFFGLDPQSDIVGFLPMQLMQACCFYTSAKFDYLPVFKPNEFFWKNHW
jgi:hypothetical protein